ncbi:Protein of unknown function, partial [Cotesia congregata]
YIRKFTNDIFIPSLEQQICSLLQGKCNSDVINDVKANFNYSKTLFDFVSTEHLRFEVYKKMGCFIEPENFIIGQTEVEKIEDEKLRIENEDVYAVHIPLGRKLSLFLEIPGVFSEIQNNILSLRQEKTVFSNIMQGSLWEKRSASHKDKLCLPINIFFDEVETKNPLGSHPGRNKIGVTYATLPCLPAHLVSRLNCIFLSTLFYGNDRKIFGNKWVFRKLIEDIKSLQRLKDKCIFNIKKHFHVCENVSVDIMHDYID